MRGKNKGILFLTLLIVPLILTITGCPNFMQGNEVKDIIEAEVTEANAEEIVVRIQPIDPEMGSTTPNGATTVKVGIPFTVSTSANPEYAFIGWDTPSEIVTFDNFTANETSVIASQVQEDVLIIADFDARPKVISHEPFSQDGVLMNQKVRILFSEEIDPSTVNFDNITVVAKPRTSLDDPEDVTDRLLDPVVSGSIVELQFDGSNTYDAQNQVVVAVSSNVTDLSGHAMADNFSWSFITGSSTDLSAPAINDIDIKIVVNGIEQTYDETDSGTIISESGTMKIIVDASDDVSVETLYIRESILTDGDGNASSGTAGLWQSDYYGTTYENNFSFATGGDGKKNLRISVLDPPLQESVPVDIAISLDTTAPTLSGFALNGGSGYAAPGATAATISLTDPGFAAGVGSGANNYAVTFSTAEPGAWPDSYTEGNVITSITLSDPGPEGPYTVYFHAKDALGNWGYTSTPVTIDKTAPTPPTVNSHDSPYVNGSNYYYIAGGVTFTPLSSDGGSGIAGYSPNSDGSGAGATVNLTSSGTLYAVDNVGNVSTGLAVTVTQDNTDPTLTSVGAPAGPAIHFDGGSTYYTTGTSLNFTPTATDGGSGVKGFNLTGTTTTVGTPISLSAGSTYTIYAVDNAGNVSAGQSVTVTQDNTDPTPPTVNSHDSPYVNGSNYYYITGGVTFTPLSSDGGSGIAGYSPNSDGSGAGATVNLTSSGTLYAVDNVGNVSAGLAVTVTQDNTDPTTPTVNSHDSPYVNGSNYYYISGGVTFTPLSNDGGGTGIAGYSPNSDGSGAGATVNLTSSGTLYAVDNVGNVSAGLAVTVTQDNTDPTLTSVGAPAGPAIYFDGGSTYYTTGTSLNFTPTATDGGSGVKGFNLTGTTTTVGTPISLSAGSTYTIYAVDNAGNVSAGQNVTVTQDIAVPAMPTVNSHDSPYVNGSNYYYIAGGVTFTPLSSDGGSGIAGYSPNSDGSGAGATVNLTSSGTLYAVDNVGNVSAGLAVTVTQDNTAPTLTSVGAPAGPAIYFDGGSTYYTTGTSLNFTPTATDGSSGVKGFNLTGTTTTSGLPLSLSAGSMHTIYAVDNAGNVTAGQNVTVTQDNTDPTTPTVNSHDSPYVNGSNYYYISGGVTFTPLSSDGGSGIAGYSPNSDGSGAGATVNLTSSGTLYAVDNVGNVSAGLAVTVTQDNTDPTTPTVNSHDSPYVNGSNYYYISGGVTFTPLSSDGGSGIAGYSPNSDGSGAGATVNLTSSGTLYAVDNVGNVSAGLAVTVTQDNTDPTTPTVNSHDSPYVNGSNYYYITGGVTFTPLSSDGGSGIAGYSPNSDGSGAGATVNLTSSGTLYAVDNVGNVSAGLAVTVTQDNTDPTTPTVNSHDSPYVNGSNYYYITGGVTFTPLSSDGGSGIAGYSPNSDGSGAGATVNLTSSGTLYAVDNVGNVSAGLAVTVTQDNTDPVVDDTTTAAPSATYGAGVITLIVYITDEGSGVNRIKYWSVASGEGSASTRSFTAVTGENQLVDPDEETYDPVSPTHGVGLELAGLANGSFAFKLIDSAGNEEDSARTMTESGGTWTKRTLGSTLRGLFESGGNDSTWQNGNTSPAPTLNNILAGSNWNQSLIPDVETSTPDVQSPVSQVTSQPETDVSGPVPPKKPVPKSGNPGFPSSDNSLFQLGEGSSFLTAEPEKVQTPAAAALPAAGVKTGGNSPVEASAADLPAPTAPGADDSLAVDGTPETASAENEASHAAAPSTASAAVQNSGAEALPAGNKRISDGDFAAAVPGPMVTLAENSAAAKLYPPVAAIGFAVIALFALGTALLIGFRRRGLLMASGRKSSGTK